MYRCEHFRIEELVPPEAMDLVENEAILWWLFDDRLLRVADRLRKDYGPMTVNDWPWGGEYTDSGLRLPGSQYYIPTSQHAHGRALDLKPREVSVGEVRQDITGRLRDYMCQVTGVELGVSWLHIDVRNTNGQLHTFKPS